MAITLIAGSDFKNFQIKVTDKNTGNEIAFQDFSNVYLDLVDEYGTTVAQYDTAGVNKTLTLVDTTGSGDSETLEFDLFKEDTSGYSTTTQLYAQIKVQNDTEVGYSGTPAYERLYNEKNVIELKPNR